MAWKKHMQVFHTLGEPPRRGRIILLTIGCTRNSRQAPTNSVAAKPGSSSERGKTAGRAADAVLTSRLIGSREFRGTQARWFRLTRLKRWKPRRASRVGRIRTARRQAPLSTQTQK